MHEKATQRLRKNFEAAARCVNRFGADRAFFLRKVDDVLDEYLMYQNYATEWDADQWGLPTKDMEPFLKAINARHGARNARPRVSGAA